MLYLGIDQHARQITISLRDENCDVLQARQVSTRPEKINTFFQQLTRACAQRGESFTAVLEVCGFNDWLIDRVFFLVPAQAYVGEFLATFKEFPPRQKPASFSIDQVMEKLQTSGGSK